MKTNGGGMVNFVGWLELDINTSGCRLSGDCFKCSGTSHVVPVLECVEERRWMRTTECVSQ